MSLIPGIPTNDLKNFYKKFIKQTIKSKTQVVNILNYFNSDKFIIDLEENLDTEINVSRDLSNFKFSKTKLNELKNFYNEKFKLIAKEITKGRVIKIINYILSDYSNDLELLNGTKSECKLSKKLQLPERLPSKPKPTKPKPSKKPPSTLPTEMKEVLKLDKQKPPQGADELTEGLTNFYLSQKFQNKASFLVQRDINNLRFEDIELVVNIDRKKSNAFVDDDNQELIFNFIRQARKDTVVIFLGVVDYNDFDKDDIRSSHSNLLIYRKSKKSLERFEPDSTPLSLDEDIDEIIKDVFDLNNIKINRFISPTNLCVRLQGLEESERQMASVSRNLPTLKKQSIACFFWNVVYLQARLNDLDSTQDEVVQDILTDIKMKNRSLALFIRNYSITLVNLLNAFKNKNPRNNVNGNFRRNVNFYPMKLRQNTNEEKLTQKELKSKSVSQLKTIAREFGITNIELKGKKKKQIITMILDRQVGLIRPEEDLDNEIDVEGAKTSFTKLINDVLSGKVNPKKDKAKLQKQFDKMDKGKELTGLKELSRITTRIDIAFINVIGLGDITVGGKKLGNPKDHGQPPFTKTEKTVIGIAKKLNPLGLLSETDFLVKSLNFIKSFFGVVKSSARNADRNGIHLNRNGVDDIEFTTIDFSKVSFTQDDFGTKTFKNIPNDRYQIKEEDLDKFDDKFGLADATLQSVKKTLKNSPKILIKLNKLPMTKIKEYILDEINFDTMWDIGTLTFLTMPLNERIQTINDFIDFANEV